MKTKTLRGQMLVAAPDMEDSFFRRALILICEHDADKGAIGFIVNHPSELTLRDLMEDMQITPTKKQDLSHPVFLGGPVQPDLGFALFSGTHKMLDSAKVGEGIRVTASRDLLEHCAAGEGPDELLVTMGYAGWTQGQLERELDTGSWWLTPPSSKLVFQVPPEERWNEAVRQLGLKASSMYCGSGHA